MRCNHITHIKHLLYLHPKDIVTFLKNLKSHENWHNNAIIFQIRANSNLKSNKNKSKSFSGEGIMRSWLSQHSL